MVVGSLLVALTMVAVVVPTAALWSSAGGALSHLLTSDRTRRAVGPALAALVVATVVDVWI